MSVNGLPDPGPRPEAFAFPFAAASAALGAVEEAVAELRATVAVHEDAIVSARVDFEGETRLGFDRGFAQLVGEIEASIGRLQVQSDHISDEIAQARRRREASLDATAEWGQAMQRYEEDLAGRRS